MQYTEKVMEAFQNPKNVGEIENYDGMGMIGSEACGDIMQVFIKVENGVIADAKFKTFGCAAAIATSSTATEMIKGMTVDEALRSSRCWAGFRRRRSTVRYSPSRQSRRRSRIIKKGVHTNNFELTKLFVVRLRTTPRHAAFAADRRSFPQRRAFSGHAIYMRGVSPLP